jgi:hypothetical protein
MPDGGNAGVVQLQVDSVTEIHARGFTDIRFFAKLALPEVMKKELPDYYIHIWLMLVQARTAPERAAIIRFLLGLPRGFIKTTFIKILICWFVVYDLENFVLFVGAEDSLAYNVLADIDGILASPNMEKVYGKWAINKAIDNRECKTASYRGRNIILLAVGVNSNIRGINIDNRRPGIIFFDDAQPETSKDSEPEYAKFKTKIVGTFLKLVDFDHAIVLYVGNMYIGNCLLAEFADNDGWISLVTGCILEDGSSLWPEVKKVSDLYEGYRHDAQAGLGHVWFAEMMNERINERTSLLPDGVLPESEYTGLDVTRAEGGFITIDPAGMKVLSDDNVIMANLIINDAPIVVEGDGDQREPQAVIQRAVQMCLKYGIGMVGVESAGYQGTLAYWANKYCTTPEINKLGIDLSWIRWVELPASHARKTERIIGWVRECLKGAAGVNGESRLKILWQALAYKFNKQKNKDDWMDCGAMAMIVKNSQEMWQMAKSTFNNHRTYTKQAVVVDHNTPF